MEAVWHASEQVCVEGLVHTKADIVGQQIKDVALATDLKDVSNILYCCYLMCLLLREAKHDNDYKERPFVKCTQIRKFPIQRFDGPPCIRSCVIWVNTSLAR